jgi:lactate dehydrogenase-like 2-hydroxyacid dehydrogenase
VLQCRQDSILVKSLIKIEVKMPTPSSFKENKHIYVAIYKKLYGLDTDIELESVTDGIQDYNFFVIDKKSGEKSGFFSIKRNGQGEINNPEYQKSILQIQQELAQMGVMLPSPIASLRKNILEKIPATIKIDEKEVAVPSDIAGRNVVLSAYLSGKAVSNPTLEDFEDMGEQHGLFLKKGKELLQNNLALAKLENPVSFENLGKMLVTAFGYDDNRSIESILFNEDELHERKNAVVESLKQKLESDTVKSPHSIKLTQEFIQRTEGGWYKNTLLAYQNLISDYKSLTQNMPSELLHGDMHLGNQFANKGGIFDMGWMGVGPAFLDFLQPLVINCREVTSDLEHFSPAKANAYLKGLEKHRLLTEIEATNINTLLAITHLRSTATRLMSMILSEKISDISRSPVELTELHDRFNKDFYNKEWKVNNMSKAKENICLIATEIGLIDDEPIKKAIAELPAFYHSGIVTEKGELIIEGGKTSIESLKDGQVHYVHIGKQNDPQTLVKLTATGDFKGVIVAPEKVLSEVKAEYKGRCGSGTNNIDRAANEDVVITNTPGGNAPGTTFHAIRSILDLAGEDGIIGKKITIVAAGYIGTRVAETLHMLGADITLWNRSGPTKDNPENGPKDTVEGNGLKYLFGDKEKLNALKGAEFVSLNLPETAETRGFIGEEEIKQMADNVTIINFARPAVVNPYALEAAIRSKKVAGVVIDGDSFGESDPRSVLEPFLKMARELEAEGIDTNNLLLLPHIGGDTIQQDRERVMGAQVKQFYDYVTYGVIHNLQSDKQNIPSGCTVAEEEKKQVRQLEDSKIYSLLKSDQKIVFAELKNLFNQQGLQALRDISKATISGELKTGTKEFTKFYGYDFSNREITLPKDLDPRVAKSLQQIIGTMGATLGKHISNDNSPTSHLEQQLARRNSVSKGDVTPSITS